MWSVCRKSFDSLFTSALLQALIEVIDSSCVMPYVWDSLCSCIGTYSRQPSLTSDASATIFETIRLRLLYYYYYDVPVIHINYYYAPDFNNYLRFLVADFYKLTQNLTVLYTALYYNHIICYYDPTIKIQQCLSKFFLNV